MIIMSYHEPCASVNNNARGSRVYYSRLFSLWQATPIISKPRVSYPYFRPYLIYNNRGYYAT